MEVYTVIYSDRIKDSLSHPKDLDGGIYARSKRGQLLSFLSQEAAE